MFCSSNSFSPSFFLLRRRMQVSGGGGRIVTFVWFVDDTWGEMRIIFYSRAYIYSETKMKFWWQDLCYARMKREKRNQNMQISKWKRNVLMIHDNHTVQPKTDSAITVSVWEFKKKIGFLDFIDFSILWNLWEWWSATVAATVWVNVVIFEYRESTQLIRQWKSFAEMMEMNKIWPGRRPLILFIQFSFISRSIS